MRYRTIWISDLHLGTHHCNAEGLLEFLRYHDCERLYLVGDIVDMWHLRRNRYWPQAHNDVVQKLLRKARKGTEIIWVPGNHDEFCHHFAGTYGNVIIKPHHLHHTADRRRLLVLHGHQFDTIITRAKWLAHLGDLGYLALLKLNPPLNRIRTAFGLGYWSLSAHVKRRVKEAVCFISRFQQAVVHFAELHHADGIVCGHIHTPAIQIVRDTEYYNCGDWVENSTALVEHHDGQIELIRWHLMREEFTPELELAVA